MRIFQSEKQVTVSIRLNALSELFSAGRALVSESHLKEVTRDGLYGQPDENGLPEADPGHPFGTRAAEDRTEKNDRDRRGGRVDRPDSDRNCGRCNSRRLSVHCPPLSGVSLLKAKGRLLPFIRNFEQKLIYISLIE